MRSVDTLVSSNTLLDKMSVHLNGLLRTQEPQVDKAVQLLDNMFLHASKAMESDSDKQVLSVLKCQVSSFIGVTLGVKPFLDQHEQQQKEEDSDSDDEENKLSWFSAQEKESSHHDLWAEKKKYHEENNTDIYAPEHAEHERIRQLEEEHYGQNAGSGEDEDDEEEKEGSSESEYEEVIERVAVKSREIGGAGGFEVVRRKQKKKKTTITTNFTYNHSTNSYDNNQAQNNDNYNNSNYRKQPPRQRVRITEFRPTMLERLPSEQTFCMPVFFPSEDSYSVGYEIFNLA